MAHILIASFFGLIFVGGGVAAQQLLKDHGAEIVAALRGEAPVRRPAEARFRVTLRPAPAGAMPPAAAAA